MRLPNRQDGRAHFEGHRLGIIDVHGEGALLHTFPQRTDGHSGNSIERTVSPVKYCMCDSECVTVRSLVSVLSLRKKY